MIELTPEEFKESISCVHNWGIVKKSIYDLRVGDVYVGHGTHWTALSIAHRENEPPESNIGGCFRVLTEVELAQKILKTYEGDT
jgi:hypothetical protein